MSISLLGVEWRAINIGELKLPVICAQINVDDGSMTDETAQEIYNAARGYVVACSWIAHTSFWGAGLELFFNEGNKTWSDGDLSANRTFRSAGAYRYCDYLLTKNGYKIIEGVSPGAFSTTKYHYAPLIVYTDNQGNIYPYRTQTSRLKIAMLSTEYLFAITENYSGYLVDVPNDGEFRYVAYPSGYIVTQPIPNVNIDDISDVIVISKDPYQEAGDSEPGGGDGTFDYSGNPPGGFDDFQLPTLSAVDTGFVTLYNPTISELQALSNYLWSNNFDLNTFKKLVNDPMDLFLGLSIVPVAVPDGGRSEVGIGLIGTEIYMTKAASQYVKFPCGSVAIPRFTGSYLDYDPYTTIEIYLPYIGVRTLKADEVVGSTLAVSYAVDILSGACVAWIDVDGHLTYTYMGQCATSIPIVSGDWTNLINGIISIVGSTVGGAVKGGIGGAIAGGVAASASVAVSDGKISVDRAGSISSAGGLLAHPKPFIIMSAPWLHKPAAQNTFEGYPAYITYQLGDASGYTEVEKINLQGVKATEEELTEIKGLLLSGVIL